MNRCPYSRENCPYTDVDKEKRTSAVSVSQCPTCGQTLFRCSNPECQAWNRPFARHCTQCGSLLSQKPAVWPMAYANARRSASIALEQTDTLETNHGFRAWSVDLDDSDSTGDIPALLAFDGLVLVPNLARTRLEARNVANGQLQWHIGFERRPTHGSTPVYYGLHLFYPVATGIRRVSIFDGEDQLAQLHGVSDSTLTPAEKCASLIFDVPSDQGRIPVLLSVMKEHLLFYDIKEAQTICIPHHISPDEDRLRSPVLCGNWIVLTSEGGRICVVDLRQTPPGVRLLDSDGLCFSAPVAVNGKTYFEAIELETGRRAVGCYKPGDSMPSYKPLEDGDQVENLDSYEPRLIYPPLTTGRHLILSSVRGDRVYLCTTDGVLSTYTLQAGDRGLFVSHRAIVCNHQVYSASRMGLAIFDLHTLGTSSCLRRAFPNRGSSNPLPIAAPIRYADKLFVLCKNQLFCMSIFE